MMPSSPLAVRTSWVNRASRLWASPRAKLRLTSTVAWPLLTVTPRSLVPEGTYVRYPSLYSTAVGPLSRAWMASSGVDPDRVTGASCSPTRNQTLTVVAEDEEGASAPIFAEGIGAAWTGAAGPSSPRVAPPTTVATTAAKYERKPLPKRPEPPPRAVWAGALCPATTVRLSTGATTWRPDPVVVRAVTTCLCS